MAGAPCKQWLLAATSFCIEEVVLLLIGWPASNLSSRAILVPEWPHFANLRQGKSGALLAELTN